MHFKKAIIAGASACIVTISYGQSEHNNLIIADTPAMAGYKLAWADEFNKDGKPDTANWRYEKGFVRNEDLQWYQEENAFCKDGLLVIEGRKERVPNPSYKAGSSNWKTKREIIQYTA